MASEGRGGSDPGSCPPRDEDAARATAGCVASASSDWAWGHRCPGLVLPLARRAAGRRLGGLRGESVGCWGFWHGRKGAQFGLSIVLGVFIQSACILYQRKSRELKVSDPWLASCEKPYLPPCLPLA